MHLDINPAKKQIILTPENQAEKAQLREFSKRCKFINMGSKVEYDFDVELIEGNWSEVEGLVINARFKAEDL